MKGSQETCLYAKDNKYNILGNEDRAFLFTLFSPKRRNIMSYTTIVGYPRIGRQRELKFLTEAYFKGKSLKKNSSRKRLHYVQSNGFFSRVRVLVIFRRAIFRFMTAYWIRHVCWVLCHQSTETLGWASWIRILLWQGVIRERRRC